MLQLMPAVFLLLKLWTVPDSVMRGLYLLATVTFGTDALIAFCGETNCTSVVRYAFPAMIVFMSVLSAIHQRSF